MRILTDEHLKIALGNGISHTTLQRRVYQYKWSIERAITEKTRKRDYKNLKKALENNISKPTYYSRLRNGWSKEQACSIPVGEFNKSNYIQRLNGNYKKKSKINSKYDTKNKCPYDYNLLYNENICLETGNCKNCWESVKEK